KPRSMSPSRIDGERRIMRRQRWTGVRSWVRGRRWSRGQRRIQPALDLGQTILPCDEPTHHHDDRKTRCNQQTMFLSYFAYGGESPKSEEQQNEIYELW